MEEKKKILYVDDEDINLKLFELTFKKEFDIYTAISAEDGLKLFSTAHRIDAVISDLKMPNMDGLQFIKEIKKLSPDVICIILTGYLDSQVMLEGFNKDLIYRYLTKPWKKQDIIDSITSAFSRKENSL